MKKTLLSLLMIAAFGAINAFTAPLYFTFTGKINFVPQDIGGYAAAHGYRAGVEVTYIVVVDTARIGYTELNGVKKNQPDSINEGRGYRADYFFDSLLTPSLFSPAVTDLSSGSNLGYHITMKLGANTSNTASFQVTIGNPNHRTQIQVTIPNSTDNLFLPVVGTSVTASEAYMNSSVASSSASMSMTLIAVSATRPSIGIRAFSRLDQSWMRADFQEGSLSMRNNTGRMLSASILNLEGKIVRAMSLGAVASFPASSLPLPCPAACSCSRLRIRAMALRSCRHSRIDEWSERLNREIKGVRMLLTGFINRKVADQSLAVELERYAGKKAGETGACRVFL